MRKIVNPLMVATGGREDTINGLKRFEGWPPPPPPSTKSGFPKNVLSDNRYRKEFVFIFKSDFVLTRTRPGGGGRLPPKRLKFLMVSSLTLW